SPARAVRPSTGVGRTPFLSTSPWCVSTGPPGFRRRHNRRRRPNLFAITDNGSGRAGWEAAPCWASYCSLYKCQIPALELGPLPACLNQSSICAVESTWSSCRPLGKAVSSWLYSASHPASFGRCTKPFSIIAVWACIRMILSRLRLVAGDGVEAVGDQVLDQLGARRLVLDQHDIRLEGLALLAHRPLQLRIFHAPAQDVQQV